MADAAVKLRETQADLAMGAAANPIIMMGSQGPAVVMAQTALIHRFYLQPGDDDGKFGPITKNAVLRYQLDRAAGSFFAFSFPLKVDGIVGPATWGRLTPPTVKKGSRGSTVRLLQEILKSFSNPHYDPGPIDGDFGPLTEGAVKAFQTDFTDWQGNPLAADGVVGPKTWEALWS